MPTATLLLSCPDRPGLVAAVADFVFGNGGNIVHADQHTDDEDGVFFQRVEFRSRRVRCLADEIEPALRADRRSRFAMDAASASPTK